MHMVRLFELILLPSSSQLFSSQLALLAWRALSNLRVIPPTLCVSHRISSTISRTRCAFLANWIEKKTEVDLYA